MTVVGVRVTNWITDEWCRYGESLDCVIGVI